MIGQNQFGKLAQQLVMINRIQSDNNNIYNYQLPPGFQLPQWSFMELNFSIMFQISVEELNGSNYIYVDQGAGYQKITFTQRGYYQSFQELCISLAAEIDATFACSVVPADYQYQNKFSPIFTAPSQVYSDDYYLCKIIGALPDKVYTSEALTHKVYFDMLGFSQIAQQINVVGSCYEGTAYENVVNYNQGAIEYKGQQLPLVFQQANSSSPGEIIRLTNIQSIIVSTFSGISLQFLDENYHALPLQQNFMSKLTVLISQVDVKQTLQIVLPRESRQDLPPNQSRFQSLEEQRLTRQQAEQIAQDQAFMSERQRVEEEENAERRAEDAGQMQEAYRQIELQKLQNDEEMKEKQDRTNQLLQGILESDERIQRLRQQIQEGEAEEEAEEPEPEAVREQAPRPLEPWKQIQPDQVQQFEQERARVLREQLQKPEQLPKYKQDRNQQVADIMRGMFNPDAATEGEAEQMQEVQKQGMDYARQFAQEDKKGKKKFPWE